MLRAKFVFPVAIVSAEQLRELDIVPLDGISQYDIRVRDEDNPVIDEKGNPTGKMLNEYDG